MNNINEQNWKQSVLLENQNSAQFSKTTAYLLNFIRMEI